MCLWPLPGFCSNIKPQQKLQRYSKTNSLPIHTTCRAPTHIGILDKGSTCRCPQLLRSLDPSGCGETQSCPKLVDRLPPLCKKVMHVVAPLLRPSALNRRWKEIHGVYQALLDAS